MTIEFIDYLKAQQQAIYPQIQGRIQKVLDHGQYIMDPEIKELEPRLSAYVGGQTRHHLFLRD